MKVLHRFSFFLVLAVLMVLASCAPKYGAHFSPGKHYPAAQDRESLESAPMITEAPAATAPDQESRATEAAATEVTSDHDAGLAPAAKASLSKKEQKKILRDLRKKLKGMSESERQLYRYQVLQQLKHQQHLKMSDDAQRGRQLDDSDVNLIILVVLAIFIPPLAVFLHQGEINVKFWISLALALLAIINPFLWSVGIVYALLVIFNIL